MKYDYEKLISPSFSVIENQKWNSTHHIGVGCVHIDGGHENQYTERMAFHLTENH